VASTCAAIEVSRINIRQSLAVLVLALAPGLAWAQASEKPTTVASTIKSTWGMIETEFVSAAGAMPEDKYSFVPASGEFKGARNFAQQVLHVACANFAFFKEFEGKHPDEDCSYSGAAPKKTKAEIMDYLRESFKYADQVMATISAQNMLDKVEGPYGGPSSKLGITVLAVWHASDHYGQVVEYLRMNGIVPPASR
jgi:uncharacterized damage-inducible protein DinB